MARTFECFCFLVPNEDEGQSPKADYTTAAWLPFARVDGADSLSKEGSLTLRAEPELLQRALEGMLEDPSSVSPQDGLGELANVICGQVLGDVAPESVFDLGSPSALEGEAPPFPSPASSVRAALVFDDGVIEVGLHLPS
ncbi:MAG: chemotaxis protein CheX [Myxococcota bacterium]